MTFDPLKEFYITRPSVSDPENIKGAVDLTHETAANNNRVVRSEFHVAIMTDEEGKIWTGLGFTHANFHAIDRAIQALEGLKNKIELAQNGIVPYDELFDRYSEDG